MKLHQKGFLLVELNKYSNMWGYELIEKTLNAYGEFGDFREKTLRIESKLEMINGKEKLLFKYQVSDFGISRMLDTGLLASIVVEAD